MLKYNLIDIWRLRNPDKRQFTWRKRNPIMQRHIDFWLVSDNLQDDVKKQKLFQLLKAMTRQLVCLLIALKINHLDHLIGSLIPGFWMTTITYSLFIQSIQNGSPNSPKLRTIECCGT